MVIGVSEPAEQARNHSELVWLGDGGWVACDPRLDEHDPRRVLAYLEYKDSVVYVLSVRDHLGVVEFHSLPDALAAVDALLDGTPGEAGLRPAARLR